MLAGLCALAALLLLTWLVARLVRAPRLTDDQVQQLVDEYWVCEFLGDTVRAGELFRDLDRERITLYATDDGAKWARR